jgi:hypothetical protein
VVEGFFSEDKVLLPRFQFHDVGLPVELSVKFTTIGAHPEMGEPEKFATGWLKALCKLQKNTMQYKSPIWYLSYFFIGFNIGGYKPIINRDKLYNSYLLFLLHKNVSKAAGNASISFSKFLLAFQSCLQFL